MTKATLIERLASTAGLSPAQARRSLEAIFGTGDTPGVLATALRDGDKVQWSGFGRFEARERKERRGRNPRSGEPIVVQGGAVPVFRPATALRDQLRATTQPQVPTAAGAPVAKTPG